MNNKKQPLKEESVITDPTSSASAEAFQIFKEVFFDSLPLPAWCISGCGQEVAANQHWHQTMSVTPSTPESLWVHWLHPEDQARVHEAWGQSSAHYQVFHQRVRLVVAAGHYCWFIAYGYFIRARNLWLIKFIDIDELQESRENITQHLRMYKSMLDASIDCIKLINLQGELIDMNLSGCNALGVPPDSGFGMDWLNLLPPEIRKRGRQALKLANTGRNVRFSGKSQLEKNKPFYWDNILTPLQDAEGGVTSILCVSRDITRLHQAEQRFKYISEHDELTGLPNRRMFNTTLKKYLRQAGYQNRSLALLLIDLDYFKLVNDTLGHPAGDYLLKVVANRLKKSLSGDAFIARIGGDEFAAVLPGIEDTQALLGAGYKLIADTAMPLTYQGQTIYISLSMGGVIFPQQAADSTAMIKAADIALNELKKNGRGGVLCYDPVMSDAVDATRGQMELAKQLISDEAILPFYQPKVRLEDGKIIGLEALMRFFNSQGELCFPGDIWSAFENYALMERIGYIIRDKVFADIRCWIDNALEVVPVSVNASPVEFMRDNYAEKVLQQLEHYRIPPALLEIEITEHMFDGRGAGYVFRALNLLKAQGVRISLDDFGTGYSALANIRDYPVDVIKVDRSFVASLSKGKEGLAVIKALWLLATELELDVVAEGIEDAGQRDALIREGYQLGQGFLFSVAVPSEVIAGFLKNRHTFSLLQYPVNS
nr:bifunctional diguanylate cyclase/phosphodiesterase [Tatumella sp. JGM118]